MMLKSVLTSVLYGCDSNIDVYIIFKL